jgi:hypothetical protein
VSAGTATIRQKNVPLLGGVAWIAANRGLGEGQRRRLTLGVGPFRT